MCTDNGPELFCEIWGDDGDLYRRGVFELVTYEKNCSPTFLTTRFRYGAGYLQPIDAINADGLVGYGSVEDPADLDNRIVELYKTRFDLTISSPRKRFDDPYGNGVYEAIVVGSDEEVSGRIWCGEIFSIFALDARSARRVN
jgi:hypothetical protein